MAITATGVAHVKNVHIRGSTLSVRAETSAKLTLDNLDITGIAGACDTGIELNGAADLAATTLATRNLATTLDAKDDTTVSVAGANIAGRWDLRQRHHVRRSTVYRDKPNLRAER